MNVLFVNSAWGCNFVAGCCTGVTGLMIPPRQQEWQTLTTSWPRLLLMDLRHQNWCLFYDFLWIKWANQRKRASGRRGHFDAGTWCAGKDQLNRTVYVYTFNYSCFPRHPPMMSHPPTVRGFVWWVSMFGDALVMGDRVTWFVPLMLIVGFVVDISTVWRVNMNQIIP